MNVAVVQQIADYLEMDVAVLLRGVGTDEIDEAARQKRLHVRYVHPEEFSIAQIQSIQAAELATKRGDADLGFWTGLRRSLALHPSVDLLVFRNVERLPDREFAALESIAKGDLDEPERVPLIWATTAASTLPARFVQAWPAVVDDS